MVALERELPVVEAAPLPPPPSADAIPLKLRRGSNGGTPRQVFAVALVGSLLLAMFASRDLSSWLDRLGDGPLLIPVQHAAAQWDAAMTRIGLARPAAALRAAIQRLLDAEW